MSVVSMKALLESGVHFGHRTHKWNPYMKPYIYTERNGIHILDLQQTVKALDFTYELIRDKIAEGGTILFVGTKKQAQETIQVEAERCGMPYVNARWLGGMLTNWRTIRERINELERLERMRERGDFERVTKKEALGLQRKIEKLEMRLSGIRTMINLPDLVFVVDIRREETAIHEANLLGIPVVALVDTNCDPRSVDYIIPSNDDAIRAVKLLVSKIADAVLEGIAMRKEDKIAETTPEVAVDQVELTDEELLGEATLAKISAQEEARIREEIEAAEVLETAEETEAEAPTESEETDTEPVESQAEEPKSEEDQDSSDDETAEEQVETKEE